MSHSSSRRSGATQASLFDQAFLSLAGLPLPDSVPLESPPDGAQKVSLPATLNWQDSSGAVGYDLYLGTTNPPSLLVSSLRDSQHTVDDLAGDTSFFWHVVAHNPCTGPVQSSIREFSTSLDALFEDDFESGDTSAWSKTVPKRLRRKG